MRHNLSMNPNGLRLFIAIELDEALRTQLKRAQNELQAELRQNRAGEHVTRWVAPQNIHLTLKFLGNVNRTQISPLTTALERAANKLMPFELTAQGLGCFPNTNRPNNVWVGLAGDLDAAALLARRIEGGCAELGLERDWHGFTPHLTIGRVKREASNRDRTALGTVVKAFPETTFGTIYADAVNLIVSDLKPTGPIYTTLARISLERTRGSLS